jgi:hypothetical protein
MARLEHRSACRVPHVRHTPSRRLPASFLVAFSLFVWLYARYLYGLLSATNPSDWEWAFFTVKTGIEVLAAFYGLGFALMALAYLLCPDERRTPPMTSRSSPPVGVIYLCCGEVDARALRSLATLR